MSFSKFLAARFRSLRPTASSTLPVSNQLTTLRLIALPYVQYTHNKKRTCEILLYPIPIPKPNASMIRLALDETLNLWRTGLYVLGRVYRRIWDIAFKPNVYKTDCAVQTPFDKCRQVVYDWSDRTVMRWATSTEEDVLRNVNTHAQFMHFGESAQMPFKRLQVLYPRSINDGRFDGVQMPMQVPTTAQTSSDKETEQTKDTRAVCMQILRHLGRPSHAQFKRLATKAKLTLVLTVPVYATMPLTLAELDRLVSQYLLEGGACEVFAGLESFVSLPLAYNLIRCFAYARCTKTSGFIENLLMTEQKVKPEMRVKMEALATTLRDARCGNAGDNELKQEAETHREDEQGNKKDTKQHEERRKLMEQQLQLMQTSYQQMGISIEKDDQLDAVLQSFYDRSDKQPWTVMDRRTLFHIAQLYDMKPAVLIKDIDKALNKFSRRMRIERLQKQDEGDYERISHPSLHEEVKERKAVAIKS